MNARFVDQEWSWVEHPSKDTLPNNHVHANGETPIFHSIAPQFSRALRVARLKRLMTISDLASRVRLTTEEVESMEMAKVYPATEVISRLEKVLQVALRRVQTRPCSDS